MKRQVILALCTAATFAAAAQTKKVALVVQNHCLPTVGIPMMALTDALTARLSDCGFQVINPYNSVGVDQNRTAAGEKTPEVSAMELARQLKADGAITASVSDFLESTLGTPPILHQYSVRVSFNLADARTGAAVCGETIKVKSPKYTNNQAAQNRLEYLSDLLHSAAAECAARLKANPNAAKWEPAPPPPPPPPPKRDLLGTAARPAPIPTVAVKPSASEPQKPASNGLLTLSDLDAALKSLVAAMREDELFKNNYASVKAAVNKVPMAVNGGIVNLSGDEGGENLIAAGGDTVRVLLFNTALFDVKDDAAINVIAKRVIAGGNSPMEDGELMNALKQHGSPDVLVLGDLRKFADFGGHNTYRLRLALHNLANGKIVWEGLETIVK